MPLIDDVDLINAFSSLFKNNLLIPDYSYFLVSIGVF